LNAQGAISAAERCRGPSAARRAFANGPSFASLSVMKVLNRSARINVRTVRVP
jgi:hypothetical protein